MKSQILRWLSACLLLEIGVIHYATAQTQFDKIAYLGYLAFALGVLALLAAFLIVRNRRFGWSLGFLVSLVSIAGFVVTRTIALPGLAIEQWIYPYGVVYSGSSMIFILLLILRPWRNTRSNTESPPARSRLAYLIPVLGLIVVASVFFATHRWDAYAAQTYYHVHVGSLGAVCNTPLTTFDQLEENYGLKVSLVAISMLDSVVDVRLIVVDPEKAQNFVLNQAALLVNQEQLILAPHVHKHWQLRPNLPFFMYFSTMDKTIKSGTEVSLVVGRVVVEPMTIK